MHPVICGKFCSIYGKRCTCGIIFPIVFPDNGLHICTEIAVVSGQIHTDKIAVGTAVFYFYAKRADILGLAAGEAEPMVAVVRCNGTCMNRPRINQYDGAKSCAIAASLYGGETGCSYGCLGCGDCVAACQFDAIHMNPETGLPEVDEAKCTACGACVKACPKAIIEIRPQGKKSRRVYVSCVNKDKGAVARKACTVSCIGCGKCVKTCPFEAITLENNLAYIDPNKCKSCRKCVEVCPQNSIIELNFPPRKPKAEEAVEAPKAPVAPKAPATPKVTE
mgnify:CR=1 FL=1